jgi:hypothetical protein
MASPTALAAHFEAQAKACDDLGSPFTARLCRMLPRLASDTLVGERLAEWEGDLRADALALRLCGGLHRLAIEGVEPGLAASYPPNEADDGALGTALRGALERQYVFLAAYLDNPPQTNEVARSAMLLPGLLDVARRTSLPMALSEIGASAGLNLFFDRFHHAFGDAEWGDRRSPVRLSPELRGPAPDLRGSVYVVDRSGCDIMPIDIADENGRARLRSYLWADQATRLARLDAAVGVALANPFDLRREDAAAFVHRRLRQRQAGQVAVLFHSIMWQYLPTDTREAIRDLLADAGAAATEVTPLAWVRMEPLEPSAAFATLSVTLWPGGETRQVARCDYHGRWIEIL